MSDEKEEFGGVSHDDAVVDRPGDDAYTDSDGWDPWDADHEEFSPGPLPIVEAADGMPTIHAPVEHSGIPALSPQTLVCMGDYSEFIERDVHEGKRRVFRPEKVERMPDGSWRTRERFRCGVKSHPNFILGALIGVNVDRYMRLRVEPIRPPCKHYIEQLAQYDKNNEHKKLYRLCAVRRSTEGAMMDVGNLGVYGCSARDPFDAATSELMRKWNDKKKEQGQKREDVPLFAGNPEDEDA